jgi:2-methylisocitrate lyase-like PEP mutase family enzyme
MIEKNSVADRVSLSAQLSQAGLLRLPGVYDALSTKIALQSGFSAVYMSGFSVAGTLLGQPDIGLVTASEMVERASQIVSAAAHAPVIADGDNGYGGPLNVARLVNAYERVGVSCVQLEDQVNPKRCGHMDGKEVVPLNEAVSKIRSAVQARNSSDFLIMARTDARSTHDLKEALTRAEAYLVAGADLLFVEAPHSIAEMQQIKQNFPEVPLVANMVEDGKTPWLTPEELVDLGFKIVLYPVSALLSITERLQACYSDLDQQGKIGSQDKRSTFAGFNSLVGLNEAMQMGDKLKS